MDAYGAASDPINGTCLSPEGLPNEGMEMGNTFYHLVATNGGIWPTSIS